MAAHPRFRKLEQRVEALNRELAELALAHAGKGPAEAAYWRDDAPERRRPMMEAWGSILHLCQGRQGHPICGRIEG
jgi:hypothetical protein